MRDLARPLPVAVICRLLGVPLEDEPQFGAASTVFSQGVDPFDMFLGQAQEREKQVEAGLWLRGYLRTLLEQRRAYPADDLMSALIAVEDAGDQLTEEEVVATCSLQLVAGHETTVKLIGNAVLAMLRHPQHWTALSENAGHVSAIVEETLRCDLPVQLVGRIAGEDIEINGVEVPKGARMTLLLAGANRDAAANDRPAVFDPSRPAIHHLPLPWARTSALGHRWRAWRPQSPSRRSHGGSRTRDSPPSPSTNRT